MEGLTVVKSFNRGFPPKPKANPIRARDIDSFSSYLPPLDLTLTPQKEAPAMAEDSEISIFDAHKYYFDDSTNEVVVHHDQQMETEMEMKRENKTVAAPVAAQHFRSQSAARASSASSVEGYGRNYWVRPSQYAFTTASSERRHLRNHSLNPNPTETIGVVDIIRTMASENEKRPNVSSPKWKWKWKWFFGIMSICRCWGKTDKVSELNHNLGLSLKLNPAQKVSKKSSKSLDSTTTTPPDFDLIPSPPTPPPKFKIPPETTHFPSTQLSHRALASGTGFSFPILSRATPPKLVLTSSSSSSFVRNPIPIKEPPRDSLEIFRPSDGWISRISSDSITPPIFAPNPEVHDWRKSETFSASPKSRGGTAMDEDDEAASDTSSDLFEIESFITQTSTTNIDEADRRFRYSGRSHRESESESEYEFESATRSVAPTECYAPTEASIEWSVTTAEGFDRGSLTNFSVSASASDIVDDVMLMRKELQRLGNGGFHDNDGSGGGGRRRGNGILVSCGCGVGPSTLRRR